MGLTSPEETDLVEKWLADGDEPLPDFSQLPMDTIKADIWNGVETVFDEPKPSIRQLGFRYAGLTAAAIALIILGFNLFNSSKDIPANEKLAKVEVSDSQTSDALAIEYGNESGASYDGRDQKLNFCGTIKITPRENMKLSIASRCEGGKEMVREVDVKGGSTYFAMDITQEDHSQLIVMDQKLIDELPPILQNSLIAQFGI